MDPNKEAAAHSLGFITSEAGRLLKNGSSYGLMEKLEVIEKYDSLLAADGVIPSIKKLATESRFSQKFVKKVLDELKVHGTLLDPKEKKKKTVYLPGSCRFDATDEAVLLSLRAEDPHRNRASYVTNLQLQTGTVASKLPISQWFKNRFPRQVQTGKYSPIQRVPCSNQADSLRLKFVDEESLKGAEIFNRRARADPLTGFVPITVADSDFRNTYAV
jgi:DNA-binding transcriptional regulator YhcF (GntR family)